MDIFEKNKAALLTRYPYLDPGTHFWLQNIEIEHDDYVIEYAKNGQITAKVWQNNRFAYLHSKYNPQGEADKFTSTVEMEYDTIVTLIGLGLGYQAQSLLSRMTKQNILCIYEPSGEVFQILLHHFDICQLIDDKRVLIYVDSCVRGFTDWFKNQFSNYDIPLVKIVYLPIYIDLFSKTCSTVTDLLGNYIRSELVALGGAFELSHMWLKNSLINMKHLTGGYSVSNYKDAFHSKPVVIVSAGPSLNKNIDRLHNIMDKAIVIAVYTAVNVLDKHGIKPHMVMSIDGRQIIYSDFQNMSFDMPLLFVPQTRPELLDMHRGEKCFFFMQSDLFISQVLQKIATDPPVFHSSGSVANTCVDFAVYAGADPIILIGQDYAYTGAKTHADGTYYDNQNQMTDSGTTLFQVEDIHGESVYTDAFMNSYRLWLEEYINEYGRNTTIIDATEGGALIKGTVIHTLEEAIEQYCTESISIDILVLNAFKKEPSFSPEQKVAFANQLKEIRNALADTVPYLQSAMDNSEKLHKLYQYHDEPKQKDVRRLLRSFHDIDEHLRKVSNHTKLLAHLFQRTAFQLNKRKNEEVSEGLHVAQQSFMLYAALNRDIHFAIPFLEKAIDDIEND